MNVWCFQACRTMLLGCFGLRCSESQLFCWWWVIVVHVHLTDCQLCERQTWSVYRRDIWNEQLRRAYAFVKVLSCSWGQRLIFDKKEEDWWWRRTMLGMFSRLHYITILTGGDVVAVKYAFAYWRWSITWCRENCETDCYRHWPQMILVLQC